MSGWISGFVQLPPKAIKDAEAVGQYSQVFFVSDCQEGSLEVGIADPTIDIWNDQTAQRVLLNKGMYVDLSTDPVIHLCIQLQIDKYTLTGTTGFAIVMLDFVFKFCGDSACCC